MVPAPQAAISQTSTSGLFSGMPVFPTGLPVIGTIDFTEPMEWVFWGGLAVDLIFVKGIAKWIIAAGIIAARYEYRKGS
jgi:hypothetical protein